MNTFKVVAVVGLALSMSACVSHLSKEQCQTINWRERGYNDGAAGQYKHNLSKEIADCAKFQLNVDVTAYTKGWRSGVRDFCQPSRAYQLGVDGQTYNAVCPSDLSTTFSRSWKKGLRKYCVPQTGYSLGRSGRAMPTFCAPDQLVRFRNAYEDGRRIYGVIASMQQEVDRLNSQISDLKFSIDNKRDEIARKSMMLARSHDPDKMRIAMLEITVLKDGIREQNRQLDKLQKRRDRVQAQLNREKME